MSAVLAAVLWLLFCALAFFGYCWVAWRWQQSLTPPPAPLEPVDPEVRRRRLPFSVAVYTANGPMPISQHATPLEARLALRAAAQGFRAQGWELHPVDEMTYRMLLPCQWGYWFGALEVIHDADAFGGSTLTPGRLFQPYTHIHPVN